MTKLINLESYLECCQYAHLFAEDPANLIPNPNGLPLAYRDFCNRHQSQSFLPIPAITIAQPTILTPRKSQLPQQNIGLTLPDNSSDQIFIVREANSLVLRSLQSRYIYANVYRYWSYVEQLQQFTHSDKPLVIYDFDSFTPSEITPLTFQNYGNAPYPIPIIDTRSIKKYDALKLSQSYEKIYNSICLAIAKQIVQDLKLNPNNLLEVANYIKKINLFQNKVIEFTSSEYISLIIEINHRFYSYNLSRIDLEGIIYRHFPIADLKKVISETPNYHFVLLSSYAKLPSVKRVLEQQFHENLLVLDLSVNNFSKIWQRKLGNNFALYGQHLDRISFFVRRAGEEIEIRLPEETCYEGEQEATIYGQYLKDGKLEENFPLRTKDVTLPFRINDEPFLDNETGVEQIYKIENQYLGQTPNLDIKIRFRLKPGLMPKLEILDNYDRILDSKLIDREELAISDTLGFISIQAILTFRNNKSQRFINILKTQDIQIPITLSYFTRTINEYITDTASQNNIDSLISVTRSFLNLINNYSNIENESNNGLDVYVIDDQDKNHNLEDFTKNYEKIDKRINEFLENIKSNHVVRQSLMSRDYRDIYKNIFQILGKSFAFSNCLNLDFLYYPDQIYYGNLLPRNIRHIYSIHLQNIARMSCTNQRRKAFWDLFNIISQYHQREFYKVDDYIWGYARILLWYANPESDCLSLEVFSQHFIKILSHCLTLNVSRDRDYLRDALISLIYLLTFREIDPHFVEQGSHAHTQSKRLCEKLEQNPIRSRRANIDVSLNQFFEQLLDGSATQEQVSNMIEID
ncbi:MULTISPECIES: hypothetical protein [unclassified Microcystis]|jgi:hypothetical protein|uniref:Uncharacterized protein n=1 Tax=Microcystis flos-aquae Mf_QC_C_20070823_S10D TaxID=2486236 RepID=A0A552KNL7_9CHRO|nr:MULTISPECIES: hypothetical protein [unclassified Microcystis]MCA2819457.1 hypothetical protein [Microcystis sp. M085S1]MCA2855510.1 hypothetical protein [Microcystis sp. M065S1]NCR53508.1 hypothetical protein [Microcystis aeruginosa L211-07]TRT74184.1 MAG: hypothetical protein EWV64_15030 [Microcystis flos-aquae Ma_QC_C_20070823_S18]TRT95911.1 MAG: hypothetical protein EWV65_14595 [Microcystis flos-aquae Ma_QC_C_20070823_S18D]TRV09588.1 MAG: hypothetical protein EWV45_15440 [Microcystis fl